MPTQVVHYYTIKLMNSGIAQVYEARNVRSNGLPLINLNMMHSQGRLEFVAVPARSHHFQGIVDRISQGTRTISQIPAVSSYTQAFLGGLKQLVGLTVTMVLTNPQMPSQNQVVSGRITAVVPDPSGDDGPKETVTFVYGSF